MKKVALLRPWCDSGSVRIRLWNRIGDWRRLAVRSLRDGVDDAGGVAHGRASRGIATKAVPARKALEAAPRPTASKGRRNCGCRSVPLDFLTPRATRSHRADRWPSARHPHCTSFLDASRVAAIPGGGHVQAGRGPVPRVPGGHPQEGLRRMPGRHRRRGCGLAPAALPARRAAASSSTRSATSSCAATTPSPRPSRRACAALHPPRRLRAVPAAPRRPLRRRRLPPARRGGDHEVDARPGPA